MQTRRMQNAERGLLAGVGRRMDVRTQGAASAVWMTHTYTHSARQARARARACSAAPRQQRACNTQRPLHCCRRLPLHVPPPQLL